MKIERTAAILFGGIGGFSAGLMQSKVEAYGNVYGYKILCSIDYDPVACKNHDLVTGEDTSVCMDLFSRQQYIKWHGHEPPSEWREVTPWDIWVAFDYQVPDYLFLSPPCKGFSGLLPNDKAQSEQYQALNLLTLRGLELCLEACRLYGDGELPAFIHFENVPRIRTRGKEILIKIRAIFKKYGFAYDERADHNLGEIGGLGQNRLRFLILARNEKRVPNYCYLPPKKPLKTIGDVIGTLPMPGDTEAGGPLHRLPNLQWKTWVRLALIPAGGDWRDLNKIDWEKYKIVHEPRSGAYAIENWNDTSRTVTGTAGPGRSNGAAAISDPRFSFKDSTHTAIYRVSKFDEHGPTVTGANGPNNGAICISDPRVNSRAGRYTDQYRMQSMDKPSATVTGVTDVQSGAQLIADPRVKTKLMPDSYGVQGFDDTAKTIRGHSRIMQSASSIADPRIHNNYHNGVYKVTDWETTSPTITTGSISAGSGKVISDPRMNCSPRSGTMGVQKWDQTAKTVIGSGDIHASAAAVADPRIPNDNDRGQWIIISEDGTRHRPLTTYELAMLQGFDTHLPDGRPFQLEGCSDAKAREYIGNAVPVPSATAMGNVILIAIANAEAGITFELSWNDIWVKHIDSNREIDLVH
ncbi:DNA cytosine methyltransferase [Paenibacillus albiflavus]|uniref:DNA (cytosine-5-)-methyltransferase n=1 Tax=Paenibacillus albiflavus TaxID=2545760 RepID=A0A4R4EAG5_9BACL|nr:DNA cytosine methyltransferase [Paenibacillus albiflavus]TCZ76083.1 DNA cytosine methyltransferase [Paenibacillus albiflavus]